jgi:uncharacterized protein YcbK (DUF882 family)
MSNAIVLLLASLLGALHGGSNSSEGPLLAPSTVAPVDAAADAAASKVSDVPTWPITFYFENRQESLPVVFFDNIQNLISISRDAMAALSHHVRCFRTDKERPIHPRLAEIVARATEAFGRDNVDVVSGFRARPFGAPHSKHFVGRAMDFRLPNVPSRKVAAWVWKNFRGVGVGYYPKQNFVHVDVREMDVRWVDTSLHGESAHARYFARTASEQVLPAAAPRLAYDETRAAPVSNATAVAILSLTMPSAPSLGIRGVE